MSTRLQKRDVDLALTRSVACAILRGLDDTRCHEAADLLAAKRDLEFIGYFDGLEHANDDTYLGSELMSKFDSLDLGVSREEVALSKFLECERLCAMTNVSVWRSSTPVIYGMDVGTLLLLTRRKIASLLGEFDWNEAALGMGFGPGAAVGIPRAESCVLNKIGMKPTVSNGCLAIGKTILKYFDLWGKLHENEVEVVPGCKIVTVPKNAKTDRVIAIEPLLNLFAQKGIGSMIRRRLLVAGQDLTDQSRNRRLAREASVSGSLATVDLSSASDTIAKDLVYLLLPDDWYAALAACRSSRGVLPSGEVISLQKFSSMGNGFTFELESLIFYALTWVTLNRGVEIGALSNDITRVVSVYGDDIICPVDMVDALFAVLGACGFKANAKKTHASGSFRESCGIHCRNGFDITPIYIRRPLRTLREKFLLANNIQRLAQRRGGGLYRDARLKQAYDLVIHSLPRHLRRPVLPDGFGDGGLIGSFDEVRPRRARFGLDGWTVRVFVDITLYPSESDESSVPSLFAASLMQREGSKGSYSGWRPGVDEPSATGVDVRLHRRRLWKQRPVFVPGPWRELGPWL